MRYQSGQVAKDSARGGVVVGDAAAREGFGEGEVDEKEEGGGDEDGEEGWEQSLGHDEENINEKCL